MRILIVCHLALPHVGGVEVLVDREVRALADQGHEVRLLTSDGRGSAEEPAYPASVRVVRVPAWHGLERRYRLPYPIFSPRLLPALWRAVAWSEAVHIHGFMFINTALASILARLRRRPCILTDHGGIQRFDSRIKTALAAAGARTIGRMSARLATRLVAYNTRVLRLLEGFAGRKGQGLFLPNPIDWRLCHPPTPAQRAAARAQLGWPPDRPKVLFVGRLVPEKGVKLLLEARDPSFDLAFCGPGDPSVLGTPLPPWAEYFPPRPRPDVVTLYHAADLFALPAGVREGFPVVIQEALACGLKVLTCYDPGYEPYRRVSGLTFCDREPGALRQGIRNALASQVGSNGADLSALRELCPPPEVWIARLYEGVCA
jgi:glycosyltransferase involved in cell wall biosynthesis